jgi:hypothetical protein
MNSADMKERLAAEGTEAAPPISPEEFRKMFTNEVNKWERFVKKSGIRVTDQ